MDQSSTPLGASGGVGKSYFTAFNQIELSLDITVLFVYLICGYLYESGTKFLDTSSDTWLAKMI
jgi:hypothetical protein